MSFKIQREHLSKMEGENQQKLAKLKSMQEEEKSNFNRQVAESETTYHDTFEKEVSMPQLTFYNTTPL